MKIIGCDFHTRYQQIAMLDESTGELTERRLEHESREARSFYRAAETGSSGSRSDRAPLHWFERLLAELGTNSGSGTPRRFAPAKCASRKPMGETPG